MLRYDVKSCYVMLRYASLSYIKVTPQKAYVTLRYVTLRTAVPSHAMTCHSEQIFLNANAKWLLRRSWNLVLDTCNVVMLWLPVQNGSRRNIARSKNSNRKENSRYYRRSFGKIKTSRSLLRPVDLPRVLRHCRTVASGVTDQSTVPTGTTGAE